jgi:hypothetical protein
MTAAAMTAACIDAETNRSWMVEMVSRPRWRSASLAVAMVALASEGSASDADRTEQRSVRIPGADYEVRLDGAERIASPALGGPLLAAIETWLSIEFDLPVLRNHPRIELVPPAEIAALRYRGRFPHAGTERALNGQSSALAERDTVAVYSDSTRTIYLADDWTAARRRSCPFWCTRWCIICKTWPASDTSVRRRARSSPTWRRTGG